MNRFIMADSANASAVAPAKWRVSSHQDAISTDAFTPRIRVVKGDAFTTAVGCHQCEDAPCANVCPTQAIRRGEGAAG